MNIEKEKKPIIRGVTIGSYITYLALREMEEHA